MSVSRMISDFNNPTASPNRIPVSLRRAINHLRSSSIVMQVCCISLITSTGIGLRVVSLNPSGMKAPKKPLVPSNPYHGMISLVRFISAVNSVKQNEHR